MARVSTGGVAACIVGTVCCVLGPAWLAPPAKAAGQVTAGVKAGTRSVGVGQVVLTASGHSDTTSPPTADLALTVDDSSGSGAEWRVTVASSVPTSSGSAGQSDRVRTGL